MAQGRYASASEVIRASLRLLEERAAHLGALGGALMEVSRAARRRPSTSRTSSPARRRPRRRAAGYFKFAVGVHMLFHRHTDEG